MSIKWLVMLIFDYRVIKLENNKIIIRFVSKSNDSGGQIPETQKKRTKFFTQFARGENSRWCQSIFH